MTDMPCRVTLELNAHLAGEEAREAAEEAFYDDLMADEIADGLADEAMVIEAIAESDMTELLAMMAEARSLETCRRDASSVYREIGAKVMKTTVDYITKCRDEKVRGQCIEMGEAA